MLIFLLAPALIQALSNGEEATRNYHFMAHISIGEGDDEVHCGGVIYSTKAILTAARCVAPKGRKVKASDVHIVVGAADWTDEGAATRQTPDVKKIVTFPAYTGGYNADIALLIMAEEMFFDANVNKIAVAADGWMDSWVDGTTVTVYGWGRTQENNEGVNELQEINYDLSDQDECKQYWQEKSMHVGEGMFCAGSPDEDQHTWDGDQGGPVFYVVGITNQLLGLVSWGKDKSPRDYDVMTDVSHYKDIIEKELGASDTYPWVELKGGLNHGVVVIHQDDTNGPSTICTDGVGQVEVDTICISLGYKSGVIQGSREYAGKRPSRGYGDMPPFGITDLDCSSAANVFKDCTFDLYPSDASAPCFDGQQLAVLCSNEETWKFEFTHMQTKTGKRGRAMCRLIAHHYGTQVDVKREIIGTLVNIEDGGLPVVIVENMKWRKRQDTFLARYRDLDPHCLACVATVRNTDGVFTTHIIEDDCKMDQTDAETKLTEWMTSWDPESED